MRMRIWQCVVCSTYVSCTRVLCVCVFARNGRSRKRYFLRDGAVITFFRPFPPIFRYAPY